MRPMLRKRGQPRQPDYDHGSQRVKVVDAGELPPMRKAAFLRQLPVVMEAVFRVRNRHHVQRSSRRVRGFKDITIRGGE
jgi:hypothetical protein